MRNSALVPSLGNHNEATSPFPKIRNCSRVANLLGGLIFLLVVAASPGFAQAPAVQGPTIPGVTTLRLKSDVLGEERVILVRTPQA